MDRVYVINPVVTISGLHIIAVTFWGCILLWGRWVDVAIGFMVYVLDLNVVVVSCV